MIDYSGEMDMEIHEEYPSGNTQIPPCSAPPPTRPSMEQVFMSVAMVISRRATCTSRVAVGAVLTKDRHILSTGYNGSPSGFPHCDEVGCDLDADGHCLSVIHAEANSIVQCAINGVSPVGGTIYVTHFPCIHCALLIIQAGIKEVVYLDEYRDITKSKSYLEKAGIVVRKFEVAT